MKVISLWQPYASLAAHGYKQYETRPGPPPRTLVEGDRFLIASTKQAKAEQRAAAEHPRLLRYYEQWLLPEWSKLPSGCLIGTVSLGYSFQITKEYVKRLEESEYVYGDWRPGRWAWRLYEPFLFEKPIPVRGQQGIWNYNGPLPEA